MSQGKNITRRILFTLAILLVLSLCVSLAFHAYGRYQFANAVAEYETQVGEKPVFDLSQLMRPSVPETENIATWLMAGAKALVLTREEEKALRETLYAPRGQRAPETSEAMRALIERNRSALDLLHRTADLELCNFDVKYGDPARFELPDIYPVTHASFLLNGEARLALAEGNVQDAMVAARSLTKITGALYSEPLFVVPLIGIVVGRRWIDVTYGVLTSDEPWAADLSLFAELDEMMPADPLEGIRRIASLEGPAMVDMVRRGEYPSHPMSRFLWSHLVSARALSAGWQAGSLVDLAYAETRDHEYRKKSSKSESVEAARQSLSHGISKHQMFSSQLQLARAALVLRRLGLEAGGYPAEAPPIPELSQPEAFGGERIVYQRQADGSLLLTTPAALALVPEVFAEHTHIVDDFHRILLPALN